MARQKFKPEPIPTLGDLREETCWIWLHCTAGIERNCWHKAPMPLVPVIIRWSSDASSNVLRQRARCTVCGSKGATLMHPSSDGVNNLAPFPG